MTCRLSSRHSATSLTSFKSWSVTIHDDVCICSRRFLWKIGLPGSIKKSSKTVPEILFEVTTSSSSSGQLPR
ncbi:hypothetical protein M758_UG043000 [Ceratodon purpureus]|nr:hypothetical protein M758_UG043000 [Ceratodon purpureus]